MARTISLVRKSFPVAAIFCILVLTSKTALAQSIRIDCVGDSIVVGGTDGPLNDFTFGYRSFLYSRLVEAGYNFQFVGTSTWPWNLYGSSLPVTGLDLRDVDQDYHQGYGGATTSMILNGGDLYGEVPSISNMMLTDDPDVVLLMVGINDISMGSWDNPQRAEDNLYSIVDTIVSAKPQAHVIVAQITPYSSRTTAIVKYNDYIRNELVPGFVSLGKNVTTVDQYANFLKSDGTIDAGLFANGINHPGPVGYELMSETWFNGIRAVLTLPGDANMDGAVDVCDLGILATCYGIASGMAWEEADFSGDGAVNFDDLGILATNYRASKTVAVPEPGIIVLLISVFIALPYRRITAEGGCATYEAEKHGTT